MLQILADTRIPFMQYRRHAYIFSGLVLLVGFVGLIARGGFNLGVDFACGQLIEYRFSQPVSADLLRQTVAAAGIRGAEIQESGAGETEGRDFIVRLPAETEKQASAEGPSRKILTQVTGSVPGLTGELLREELVGPRVGRELRGKATLAVIVALLGILIYVGFRYEFTYAVGGVVALAHDVLATILLLALMNREITIPVIAALLTIGGYSINDTVVVFDRIREQTRLLQKRNLQSVMDVAVNSTLSRTLITSATTFWTCCALFFLGGEVIHDFALAMVIGIGFGSYSSIYIASALALEMGQRRERRQRERAVAAA